MAGPNKADLERFYRAFGAWLERPTNNQDTWTGLASVVELYDKIGGAGKSRRPAVGGLRGPLDTRKED